MHQEDKTSVGFPLTIKGNCAGMRDYTILCHSSFRLFSFPFYLLVRFISQNYQPLQNGCFHLCSWGVCKVSMMWNSFPHYSTFATWLTGRCHCGVTISSSWRHAFRATTEHNMHFLKCRNASDPKGKLAETCLPLHSSVDQIFH